MSVIILRPVRDGDGKQHWWWTCRECHLSSGFFSWTRAAWSGIGHLAERHPALRVTAARNASPRTILRRNTNA